MRASSRPSWSAKERKGWRCGASEDDHLLPGACLIKQFSIFGRLAGAISLHAVATFSYRSGIGHPKADRRDSLFERTTGFKVHEAAIPSSLG